MSGLSTTFPRGLALHPEVHFAWLPQPKADRLWHAVTPRTQSLHTWAPGASFPRLSLVGPFNQNQERAAGPGDLYYVGGYGEIDNEIDNLDNRWILSKTT